MASQKRIVAKSNDMVWLTVGATRWMLLPQNLKTRFLQALEDIADIRGEIAAASPIDHMPPVEVVCELWRREGEDKALDVIDGCATPLRWNGLNVFGARLPAQTALCANRSIIRSILVHEFLHCLFYVQKVIEGQARGELELFERFDRFDASQDDSRLADPHFWLGAEDADSLLHHNEESVLSPLDDVYESLLGVIPASGPPAGHNIREVAIPEDVRARLAGADALKTD